MDILAIILACSLHADDQLVRTLVDVQSSGNPNFVGDLRTLKTHDALRSPAEALQVAEEIQRHGGRPAVGLLGIPLDWSKRYDRAPRELFDACTNVAIGTAALAAYDTQCSGRARVARRFQRGSHHRQSDYASRRYCVVSAFARDLGVGVAAPVILRSLVERTGAAPADSPSDPPPERSPTFSGGVDSDPNDDARLFLRSSAGRAPSSSP